MKYERTGRVINSQFMRDSMNYELKLDDWMDDTLSEIIKVCDKLDGEVIKITIEKVE